MKKIKSALLSVSDKQNLKQLLNEEQKELVKYIFFPNKSSRVQSEKELKFKKKWL